MLGPFEDHLYYESADSLVENLRVRFWKIVFFKFFSFSEMSNLYRAIFRYA